MNIIPEIESHPLQPFLPENARLLLLGSFPPPKERWCMMFFYPNPQKDMWRIMGQVFYGDKMKFVEQMTKSDATEQELSGKHELQSGSKEQGHKTIFKYDEIVAFCREKGIAIFDTAQAVRRMRGNAADEHLEIVEKTDIADLLKGLPLCHDICCTGQKATDTLAETMLCAKPKVGEYVEANFADRNIRFWRMPSTSRAYPLSLDKKADAYQRMMRTIGLI